MSLMDHYWTLASDKPEERVKAAEALLSGLIEQNNEKDWNYAFKRLVRGLSSSRGSARLGFSMTLSELLEVRKEEIKVNDYLDLCENEFQVQSSMKNTEQRGLHLGMLFALQTLAKSQIWEASHTSEKDLERFVKCVIELALKKTWLREPPFFALCGLIERIKDIPKYEQAVPFIFKQIESNGLSMTCEGVAVALALPLELRLKYNANWGEGDPMDAENLSQLARVVYDLPVISGDVGETKPYIHFVWSYLLKEFCKSDTAQQPPQKKVKSSSSSSKPKANKITIEEFWQTAVDDNFFATNSSAERKLWGMEIFWLWIQSPELPNVACMFTGNLIKTLSIHLAKQDRNLHRLCKRIANYVVQELPKSRPQEVIRIVSQFMKHSPNFDKTSKFKLVTPLLASVSDSDISQISGLVNELLASLDEPNIAHKQWVLDNLVHLVRNFSSSEASKQWVGSIFDALVPLAYFMPETNDEKLAAIAQGKIMTILASTLGNKGKSNSRDQYNWPYLVTVKINEYAEANPKAEFRIEFDEETQNIKDKAENTLKKINKKRTSSKHSNTMQLQALELLFSMLLLQVYASVPDSIPMVEELQMCYKKMREQLKNADEVEDEVDTSLVLTEIIISLLSQNSVVLRKLSEDVWRLFASEITEESLKTICEILSTSESKDGQQSLFNIENDDSEDNEDEMDVEEEEEFDGLAEMDAENAQKLVAEGEGEDDADEDDDDEELSDEESAEEDDDTEMDEATKNRLAEALGVKNFQPPEPTTSNRVAKDVQPEEDSSSDESMNDEQMSALDGHLTVIFRERKKLQNKAKEQRQQNKLAKQSIVTLKSRIVDLLDIYLAEQPENNSGLVCLDPLLNLINTTNDRQLSDKAREFLRNRFCRKTNFSIEDKSQIKQCFATLEKVHAEAVNANSKVFSAACNQVSVFLVKLILNHNPKLISKVSAIYSKSLENWYLNKDNKTTPALFTDFVNFLNTKRN